MTNLEIAAALVKLGGREWHGGTRHRVYIPVSLSCDLIDLRVSRYGTGNVSNATLAGEKISNSSAREYLSSLEGVYFDVVSGMWNSVFGVKSAAMARIEGTVAA